MCLCETPRVCRLHSAKGWSHGGVLCRRNDAEYLEPGIAVNNRLDARYVGDRLDAFTQRQTAGAPRSVSFTVARGF